MRLRVYQPKCPSFHVNEDVKEYDQSEYKLVWENKYDGELVNRKAAENIAEWVFEMSNAHVSISDSWDPEHWKGYSMSVGDIIDVDGELLICCGCGWMPVAWKGELENE